MADVARLAGVGIGTVSNVLNRPEIVAEGTLARVRAAIDELQFVPDRRARNLAAGSSSTIGFVVIDLGNSFFLDMTRGAERRAAELGMTVLLANSDRQLEKERVYMSLFDEERVAGILLAPSPRADDDIMVGSRWDRQVVLLNACHGPDQCCVTVDNELGGYLAARHLIDTGRRRLVFAGGPMSLTPLRERCDGVVRAVRETNGAVELGFARSAEVQADDGRRVGRRLAALPPDRMPDGVVAAADLLAVGIIASLLAHTSLRVGTDVSVIGYDDNRQAWDSAVPVSTMAQPGEAMGRTAVDLLVDELRSDVDHEHRHVVLKPSLIVRDSTRR